MYYSSRDKQHKEPFGAVSCGTAVRFFVKCDLQDNYCACHLVMRDDFSSQETKTALTVCDGGFSGIWYAPPQATLLWYTFSLTAPDGTDVTLGRGGLCESTPWQQTVYDASRSTPDWFGRGMTYQIFPDRFCRLSVPFPCAPGQRAIHSNWDEQPNYKPDAQGEISNSDFFGGSLAGITAKLDFLSELGVSTIYLNPIFLSDSNHRYNTADYMTIDPLLGNDADFRQFCKEAHKRGMRILLDGVFNHTGSNSRYFNALGEFPDVGAAQDVNSPYFSWYSFHPWPSEYDAWWGIRTLPAVNENDAAYRDFIIQAPNSVVRHWLQQGADGWRLDVADELPDDFIAQIRSAMTEEKPDSFLLGEVWEDGSNKIAYSHRRRYLLGAETNGLMNYPFRTALIEYLRGGDAAAFRESMETLRENYPRCAYYSAMNLLGTHDTPRILTVLGADEIPASKDDRAAYRLCPAQRALGTARLFLGSAIQFCFPGSPTVYYGDESGMEGFEDPFCRGTYPWDNMCIPLLHHYRKLGHLRRTHAALQDGELEYLLADGPLLVFSRFNDSEHLTLLCNASDRSKDCTLPLRGLVTDLFSGQQFAAHNAPLSLTLPPYSYLLLQQ